MHPDLSRLIELQQIDSFSENAGRRIADHPELERALDARLASAAAELAAARSSFTDNQGARRTVEKDLAMIQARLTKFKDQLMDVKTNREYQAMQKEIEVAQHDVRQLEDRVLERMIAADDLTVRVKEAESKLAADTRAVEAERRQLEEETAALQREVGAASTARAGVVSAVTPSMLSMYDTVRARRGTVVVEVKGDYCSACHVRLRPQATIELRRNQIIFQCESCQRILYFGAQPVTDEPAAGADR